MMRIGVVLAITLCSLTASAKRYTLAEAVARVTAEYPGVRAARESLEASLASLAQQQRAYAPYGDLTFSLTGHPDARCADANGFVHPDKETRERNCVSSNLSDPTRFGDNLAAAAPFAGVILNLSANIWQPIYTFGKIEQNIKNQKQQVEASRAGVSQAQADVVQNVTRAYWGLKAARAGMATLDEGVEKLEEWVDKLDKELAGANKKHYSESDLSRLKIGLDQVRIIRLDVERNLHYAQAAFRLLTDDPQADTDEEEIDLIDFDERRAEDYVQAMEVSRPEARQHRAWSRGATEVRKGRMADMLPDLRLWTRFEYGYASGLDSPANYFMWRPTYLRADFILQLSMPLDFGPRYFRLKQARADERATHAREQAALETWSIEVHRIWADAREAVGRAKANKHAEKIARGWYNAIDQQVASGIGDGRDVAESARLFFEYRLRYLQSMFDANTQVSGLERAAGISAVRRGE
jgi:outer membrane protein TolC